MLTSQLNSLKVRRVFCSRYFGRQRRTFNYPLLVSTRLELAIYFTTYSGLTKNNLLHC